MKSFWKTLDSNARAAIKRNGSKTPQRIFPYCGLSYVTDKKGQANRNEWAKFALENRGGTWEESEDQGF